MKAFLTLTALAVMSVGVVGGSYYRAYSKLHSAPKQVVQIPVAAPPVQQPPQYAGPVKYWVCGGWPLPYKTLVAFGGHPGGPITDRPPVLPFWGWLCNRDDGYLAVYPTRAAAEADIALREKGPLKIYFMGPD